MLEKLSCTPSCKMMLKEKILVKPEPRSIRHPITVHPFTEWRAVHILENILIEWRKHNSRNYKQHVKLLQNTDYIKCHRFLVVIIQYNMQKNILSYEKIIIISQHTHFDINTYRLKGFFNQNCFSTSKLNSANCKRILYRSQGISEEI